MLETGPDIPAEHIINPTAFTHVHSFASANLSTLTSVQLRKLSLYRSGAVEQCKCGFIRLTDFNPPLVYSRNGSRIR